MGGFPTGSGGMGTTILIPPQRLRLWRSLLWPVPHLLGGLLVLTNLGAPKAFHSTLFHLTRKVHERPVTHHTGSSCKLLYSQPSLALGHPKCIVGTAFDVLSPDRRNSFVADDLPRARWWWSAEHRKSGSGTAVVHREERFANQGSECPDGSVRSEQSYGRSG